ncbi:Type II secretion system protein F [Posidoniimonas polymericola]|uniref:General secretion pathway protein F n=1 Tax=Posidoniimonas polymericola TaxID=2528002 RepID=A0A5C5XUM1_9BACT|nr:type II secretion system F family protein [Posidoniimonas polymericola]TWT67006.1 Type II secretion system protein F [Posidoniimonas polymericola]
MPDFAYTARDLSGALIQGTLSAGSEREVVASLSSKELFPLTVKTTSKRVAGESIKVSAKYVTPFYSQLASLLRSGVPLLRSLQVIGEQASNPPFKAVITDITDRVEDGATLSEAMARHPRAFPELATSIVRAGGEGGFLEDALDRVALFTDQQSELRAKVLGAMAYPIILAIVGTLVVNGLIIFVVPNVQGLFDRLDERGELPTVTVWLMALSSLMTSYWGLIALGVLVAGVVAIVRWFSTPVGRTTLDRLRIKLPMAGSIYLSLAVARFCRVLGTLLKGGVPIVRSLDIAADSTGNVVLSEVVRNASENITSGETLAAPLAASGHFPRDVCEMIAVAEQSNNLEIVLEQISNSLEKSTWRRIELFVKLLEPLMLLVMAACVLVVVIALLLPIIKMSTSV